MTTSTTKPAAQTDQQVVERALRTAGITPGLYLETTARVIIAALNDRSVAASEESFADRLQRQGVEAMEAQKHADALRVAQLDAGCLAGINYQRERAGHVPLTSMDEVGPVHREAWRLSMTAALAAAAAAPQPVSFDVEGMASALFEKSHEPSFEDTAKGMREAEAFARQLVATYIDNTVIEDEPVWPTHSKLIAYADKLLALDPSRLETTKKRAGMLRLMRDALDARTPSVPSVEPADAEPPCRHRCPACRMGLVSHLPCDPQCLSYDPETPCPPKRD